MGDFLKVEAPGTRRRIAESLDKIRKFYETLEQCYRVLSEPGVHTQEEYVNARCALIAIRNELSILAKTTNTQQVLESEKPAIDMVLTGLWDDYMEGLAYGTTSTV